MFAFIIYRFSLEIKNETNFPLIFPTAFSFFLWHITVSSSHIWKICFSSNQCSKQVVLNQILMRNFHNDGDHTTENLLHCCNG